MNIEKRHIEYRRLNEITPYNRNPRKNDKAVKALANSIKEFGFNQPICIDRDGIIIVGHTRYKAAKKIAAEKIAAEKIVANRQYIWKLSDNEHAIIDRLNRKQGNDGREADDQE